MKTIEQKALAYDEALEKAKRLYEKGTITESLCHIFPEFAESEDERIRKALIRFHKSSIDIDGIKGEQIVAWLEKQGESYTKKDIDDAYLKGVCDAKQELEKQSEQNLANSAKTCKKSQRMISAEAKEALYSKPEKILLDKALDFIVETQEDNDYICEKMSEFSDEWDYCWNNCQNLQKGCVKRFLKHYEKSK